MAAVRWKIRATRAGVTAAMQGIPTWRWPTCWILCRGMNESFAEAPDSLLFGSQSDIARDAALRLDPPGPEGSPGQVLPGGPVTI